MTCNASFKKFHLAINRAAWRCARLVPWSDSFTLVERDLYQRKFENYGIQNRNPTINHVPCCRSRQARLLPRFGDFTASKPIKINVWRGQVARPTVLLWLITVRDYNVVRANTSWGNREHLMSVCLSVCPLLQTASCSDVMCGRPVGHSGATPVTYTILQGLTSISHRLPMTENERYLVKFLLNQWTSWQVLINYHFIIFIKIIIWNIFIMSFNQV